MMLVSIGIGVVAAVALITVVSVLTGGKVTNGSPASTNALVGTRAADFSLAGLAGGTVHAPYAHHEPTVLVFFGSWCAPCQREFPRVSAYLRAHPPAGVAVVGVDAADQAASAKAFVARAGFTYPVAFDPNSTVTSGDFGFQALPETVFVGSSGTVREVHVGSISDAALAAGIAALAR